MYWEYRRKNLVIFIPSYNRPAQLRLLLESIYRFIPINSNFVFDINIYYQATNDIALKGYEKLKSECGWSSINFYPKFKTHTEDIRHSLYNAKYALFWFITDDSIIRDDLNTTNKILTDILSDPKVLCFSTRAGLNVPNVIWNDSSREVDHLIEYEYCKYNTLIWNWKKQKNSHFRHPIAIDGTIIRCDVLQDIIGKSGWNTDYRAFESRVNDYVKLTNNRNYCASFINSKLVNMPVNQVVQGDDYSGKEYRYTIDELNQKYLDGYHIDLLKILEQRIVSVQQEFKLDFKKVHN